MKTARLYKPAPQHAAYIGACGVVKRPPFGDADETMESLRLLGMRLGVVMTLIRPERVAGWQHIVHAGNFAARAFSLDANVSSSLGLEFLIYAAAERQISKAIRKVGIQLGLKQAVLVVFGRSRDVVGKAAQEALGFLHAVEDDSFLDLTHSNARALVKAFNITLEEIRSKEGRFSSFEEVVADCVLERVALLQVAA